MLAVPLPNPAVNVTVRVFPLPVTLATVAAAAPVVLTVMFPVARVLALKNESLYVTV
jgi:hypothetical protein